MRLKHSILVNIYKELDSSTSRRENTSKSMWPSQSNRTLQLIHFTLVCMLSIFYTHPFLCLESRENISTLQKHSTFLSSQQQEKDFYVIFTKKLCNKINFSFVVIIILFNNILYYASLYGLVPVPMMFTC